MIQNILRIFVCTILVINQSLAQDTKSYQHEYVGTIKLSTNQILSYKLNFNMSDDGKIEGYSITDIYGDKRTKTKITGQITGKLNKISFNELNNISTKSSADKKSFCYIRVNNAKITSLSSKQIIQGQFVGYFENKTKCESGEIYLISTKTLDILAKQFINENKKKIDTNLVSNKKIESLKKLSETNILKSNEKLNLQWISEEIILEAWDGEREDLDEIEIYINGNKILDKFILRKEKKIIVIPIKEKITDIRIVGIGEGASAPCTANIILRDNSSFHSIITVLKKYESTYVKINKE